MVKRLAAKTISDSVPSHKENEKSGKSTAEAKRRAWATVNKESGGGKKSGSGRGKKESHASSRKGGRRSHSRSKS